MNEYFWVLAFTFLSTGSISILALTTDRGYLNPLNRSFSWFASNVALWSLGVCIMFFCNSSSCATWWSKIYTIPVCFLPVSYLHYVYHLTGKIKWRILFLFYMVAAFLVLLIFQGSIVDPVREKYGFEYMIQAGPYYFLVIILFLSLVVYSIGILIESYRKSEGIKKQQLIYVLLGTGVGYIGGIPNLWVPYNKWIYPLNPYASLSIVFFVAVTAYGILRYRLIDIRFLIQESKRYLFSAGLLGLVLGTILGGVTKDLRLGIMVFIASTLAPYLQNYMHTWIGRVRSRRDLVDPALNADINSITDRIQEAGSTISDLGDTVAKLIHDEFPVNKCGVFFFDHEVNNFYLQSQIGVENNFLPRLTMEDPLIAHMNENKDILILYEARQKLPVKKYELISKILIEMNMKVCVPLVIRNVISGFMVLGPKTDGKPYFINELNQLKDIANETGHSLRYALGRLEDNSRTRKWAHSLHQNLKALKSAFDYFKNSDPEFQKNKDKMEAHEEGLKVIKKQNMFFKYLVHTNRIESEAQKNAYQLKSLNISKVLEDSLREYRLLAKSKNVEVNFNAQNKSVEILGNDVDLKAVFDSILSNAFRYVPDPGHIEITGITGKENYQITFFNNGPSIPEKYLNNIFQENFQIRDGLQGASGLGLANSKRIIELHNGKISLKNGENNLGVNFIITLPIKDENGGPDSDGHKTL